jgi:hypothetical protein
MKAFFCAFYGEFLFSAAALHPLKKTSAGPLPPTGKTIRTICFRNGKNHPAVTHKK